MEGKADGRIPGGADQVIVTYGTAEFPGLQGAGLTRGLMTSVAADADARSASGWRIVSLDTTITGYTRSAGSVLTNSGTGSPTDVVVTVVYARAATSAP